MKLIHIKIITALIAASTLACNAPKQATTTTTTNTSGSQPIGVDPALVSLAYASSDVVVTSPEEDPLAGLEASTVEPPFNTLIASIKRTKCYGKCPSYEAKIFASGLVLFEGQQHSIREGLYEAYLLPAQIDSLMMQAERIEFFDMAQHYPVSGFTLSGLPSTITYLKGNISENKIINNHNAPLELRRYERYFEKLLDELDWKPVLEH